MLPCVRCPPWDRSIVRILSPGWSTEKYTAMLACAPLWGWTLAWSAPKSCLARSLANCSTTSAYSHPPYQRLPGYPSAYLLVSTLPWASRTARLVKFSLAMSSMFSLWRRSSCWIASKISGSVWARVGRWEEGVDCMGLEAEAFLAGAASAGSSRARRLGSVLRSESRQRKYTARLWPMGSGTSRSPARAAGSNSRTRNALSAASGKYASSRSRCPRVMVKIRSASSTSAPVSGWERTSEMSIPISASASTA